MFRRVVFIIVIGLLSSALNGQGRPRPADIGAPPVLDRALPDSTQVSYFTLEDIDASEEIADTLFEDFEKYASVRQFRTGALSLGNLGSSHRRIIYSPRKNLLTDPGYHQYDNYKIDLEDFRYYRVSQAYNDLFFSPQDGQQNFNIRATFSGNYKNDVNLSLDFERISQEGFYRDQDTKSTWFGLGLWKQRPEKNHQIFFRLLGNNHNENHNGGIPPGSFSGIRDRPGTRVFLTQADTRHQHFTYALDNFLDFGGEKYRGHHQLRVDDGFFRFSDEGSLTTNDTLVYNPNYAIENRGLRHVMQFFRVMNTIDLAFDSKGFGLTLGLRHQLSRFDTDEGRRSINDAFAWGKVKVGVGRYAELVSKGELGIGQNAGNFLLDGKLTLRPIEDVILAGKLRLQRYDPTILEDRLSVSFIPVYDNEFSKINELYVSGNLTWEKIRTSVEVNTGIIDNPVAQNDLALPIQIEGSINYLQLMLTHRWFYKWVGLENSIVYQTFSDNIYALPQFYGIHNAYVQFNLFNKNLLVRLGGLYYSLRTDAALAFLPLTGAFYPVQSSNVNPSYPYYEAYANFRISKFRVFVKLENANDLFIRNEFYQVTNYPQIDWKLRLGVRWVIRG